MHLLLKAFLENGATSYILITAVIGAVGAGCAILYGIWHAPTAARAHPEDLLFLIGPNAPPMTLLVLTERYATALGLFVTVLGLGDAFAGIGGPAAASSVGPAISRALSGTAVGVALAISCGIAVAVLSDLAQPHVDDCVAILEAREQASPGRATGPPTATSQLSDAIPRTRVARVRIGDTTLFAIQHREGDPRFVRTIAGTGTLGQLSLEQALEFIRGFYPHATLESLWDRPVWADYPETPELPPALRAHLALVSRQMVHP